MIIWYYHILSEDQYTTRRSSTITHIYMSITCTLNIHKALPIGRANNSCIWHLCGLTFIALFHNRSQNFDSSSWIMKFEMPWQSVAKRRASIYMLFWGNGFPHSNGPSDMCIFLCLSSADSSGRTYSLGCRHWGRAEDLLWSLKEKIWNVWNPLHSTCRNQLLTTWNHSYTWFKFTKLPVYLYAH